MNLPPAIATVAVSACIVLATGAPGADASARDMRGSAVSTEDYVPAVDREAYAIATEAGKALISQVKAVRATLDAGYANQALNELSNTEEFAEAIRDMTPTIVVADRIRRTRDSLRNETLDVFFTELLPLYESLDDIAEFAPQTAKAARRHVDAARRDAKAGLRDAARDALDQAADSLSRRTVYLPVNFIKGRIAAAREALQQDKPDIATAKAAVTTILESMQVRIDSGVAVSDTHSSNTPSDISMRPTAAHTSYPKVTRHEWRQSGHTNKQVSGPRACDTPTRRLPG